MPSNAAVLLFAKNHKDYFPDAIIRLGRFAGTDKRNIIDQQDVEIPIVLAIDPILAFIRRHTSMAAEIGAKIRRDIPEYPPAVIREAVTNALLHADYSIIGANIEVAIYDDRIEITNPGSLPFGLSMEMALSGRSQLRNRVIGRVFRELNLIEKWGSGLTRMLSICREQKIQAPRFEEQGRFFKTILYHDAKEFISKESWHLSIVEYLQKHKEISRKTAQKLWGVTTRTATSRLRKLCDNGVLVEIAIHPFDPHKTFRIAESRSHI